VVGHHHVRQIHGLVLVPEERHPLAGLIFARLPAARHVVGDHFVDPAVQVLRALGARPAQCYWARRGGAEAHVGEPEPVFRPDAQRQVRPGRHRPAVRADPRQQPLNAETETFEGRAEQLAVLVAVAAALAVDELGLDRLQVHPDAAAEHQVQVLERDRRQVGLVQRGERRLRRLHWPVVAEPSQVGVQVELADGPLVRCCFWHRHAGSPAGGSSAGGVVVTIRAISAAATTPPPIAPAAISLGCSDGPILYLPGPAAASVSARVM
jgi:hypothetical protein